MGGGLWRFFEQWWGYRREMFGLYKADGDPSTASHSAKILVFSAQQGHLPLLSSPILILDVGKYLDLLEPKSPVDQLPRQVVHIGGKPVFNIACAVHTDTPQHGAMEVLQALEPFRDHVPDRDEDQLVIAVSLRIAERENFEGVGLEVCRTRFGPELAAGLEEAGHAPNLRVSAPAGDADSGWLDEDQLVDRHTEF